MATFRIDSTFEIPQRRIYALAGDVLEGTVRTGMHLQIRLNNSLSFSVPIHSIERAALPDGVKVCLCLQLDDDALEFVRALGIKNETAEVSEQGPE